MSHRQLQRVSSTAILRTRTLFVIPNSLNSKAACKKGKKTFKFLRHRRRLKEIRARHVIVMPKTKPPCERLQLDNLLSEHLAKLEDDRRKRLWQWTREQTHLKEELRHIRETVKVSPTSGVLDGNDMPYVSESHGSDVRESKALHPPPSETCSSAVKRRHAIIAADM
ncbi:hypothetical protein LSAT2_023202 [Lamellibrachia satsuma]|nr:hypothetical protein LSAT2_023202 [Lamellibrachia satsuma]